MRYVSLMTSEDRGEEWIDVFVSSGPLDAAARAALLASRAEQPRLSDEEQYYRNREQLGGTDLLPTDGGAPFVWEGVVETEFRGFEIDARADGEYDPGYEAYTGDGLFARTTKGARVFTGMFSGPARLRLEALEAEPAQDPGWEQNSELAIETTFGWIRVEDQSIGSPLLDVDAAIAGPGRYRTPRVGERA